LAQEFTIKSELIEQKINQLLPSQGGYQAGVDFSASTMVVPIVDLTEVAEGSNLRQDLQRAVGYNFESFNSKNETRVTLINTTGYYQVQAYVGAIPVLNADFVGFELYDGVTYKTLYDYRASYNLSNVGQLSANFHNFDVFLGAGISLVISTALTSIRISGNIRQIADINGNLVNPS
tara:strand:+ start:143 stop:673 length:531 start_codon:yes stop_codon:yes gene_type:complete